jgi:hypothetical protein
MFKLRNKGRAWRYVRSMYAATTRAVRCGLHTSDWFDIDGGTAQGDTLSCILFDIFMDLLREVEAASQGVPVRPEGVPSQTQGQQTAGAAASGRPAADDVGAALVATLTALMFDDNFTGVAATEEALPCIINTCMVHHDGAGGGWRPTLAPLKVQWWSLRPSLQRRLTTAACVGGRHHSPQRMPTSTWGSSCTRTAPGTPTSNMLQPKVGQPRTLPPRCCTTASSTWR